MTVCEAFPRCFARRCRRSYCSDRMDRDGKLRNAREAAGVMGFIRAAFEWIEAFQNLSRLSFTCTVRRDHVPGLPWANAGVDPAVRIINHACRLRFRKRRIRPCSTCRRPRCFRRGTGGRPSRLLCRRRQPQRDGTRRWPAIRDPLASGRTVGRELRGHSRVDGTRRIRHSAHSRRDRRPEWLWKVHPDSIR